MVFKSKSLRHISCFYKNPVRKSSMIRANQLKGWDAKPRGLGRKIFQASRVAVEESLDNPCPSAWVFYFKKGRSQMRTVRRLIVIAGLLLTFLYDSNARAGTATLNWNAPT